MRKWYGDNGIVNRLPKLAKQNLIDTSSVTTSQPELKGPGVKAANTKDSIGFVADLAQKLNDGTEHKRRRAEIAQDALRMVEIIDGGAIFLTSEEQRNLASAVHSVVMDSAWLATNAARKGTVAWKLVPKHHYLVHLVDQARLVNPKFVRTYKSESLMGRFSDLYSSLANGPQGPIQADSLNKYLLGLQIRFGDHF